MRVHLEQGTNLRLGQGTYLSTSCPCLPGCHPRLSKEPTYILQRSTNPCSNLHFCQGGTNLPPTLHLYKREPPLHECITFCRDRPSLFCKGHRHVPAHYVCRRGPPNLSDIFIFAEGTHPPLFLGTAISRTPIPPPR